LAATQASVNHREQSHGGDGTTVAEPGIPLPIGLLYRHCDPAELPFVFVSELDDPSGPIGQDRAVEAVEFAVAMRRKGYNIYALGASGTGKHTVIENLLRRHAESAPAPPDWCYVNNFVDPQKPRRLQLPPGRGGGLREGMRRLVEELRVALPAAFERDEYRARLDVIEQQFKQRNERAFGGLQRRAEQKGITMMRTPMGLALAPRRDGKVLTPEMFETLPEAERTQIQGDLEDVQGELEVVMQKVPQWEREHREAVRELSRETTGGAIALMMNELRAGYRDLPDVAQYLDAVERDIKENADDFLPQAQPPEGLQAPAPVDATAGEARFRRYRVNVIVDNSGLRGARVVYEDNPTHQTLVGRVEHLARFGALVTDFNLLAPGALHCANGGYLLLDAQRLLAGNFGWASLKRALNAGEIRIETLEQALSMASTVSLQPEPIPLDVKVVLLGPPQLYYLLSVADDDFKELFKIAADFDDRIERTSETTLLYARFIAGVVRREKLLPFDRDAAARVIEQASRIVGDADRLSTGLREIVDLLQEADQLAAGAGKDVVTGAEVQRAIDAQFRRGDRVYRRLQEEIGRRTICVETDGEVLGQVVREREHGTMDHLLVMPLTPFEIAIAKIWANGLVIIVAVGLSLYFVVRAFLGIPIAGSIPLFLLGVAIYLFFATAIGIFLGTVARSMPQLGLLFLLVYLPLAMLSGSNTPLESIPMWLATIMQISPSTHFVSFAQGILYRGAGFGVVWREFLAVALIGGLFFYLALLRFRKVSAAAIA
jgi:hypothetical protein